MNIYVQYVKVEGRAFKTVLMDSYTTVVKTSQITEQQWWPLRTFSFFFLQALWSVGVQHSVLLRYFRTFQPLCLETLGILKYTEQNRTTAYSATLGFRSKVIQQHLCNSDWTEAKKNKRANRYYPWQCKWKCIHFFLNSILGIGWN